jgi:hypothetical protein
MSMTQGEKLNAADKLAAIAIEKGGDSPGQSRTETKDRRTYWENKVSPEAVEVCQLLGEDWWDLMTHSSPHLTLGTGQGGATGHEIRDAGIMTDFKKEADKRFEKKMRIKAPGSWGQMLGYLKDKPTAEELKEKQSSSKAETRTAEHQAWQKEQDIQHKKDLSQGKAKTEREKKEEKKKQDREAFAKALSAKFASVNYNREDSKLFAKFKVYVEKQCSNDLSKVTQTSWDTYKKSK